MAERSPRAPTMSLPKDLVEFYQRWLNEDVPVLTFFALNPSTLATNERHLGEIFQSFDYDKTSSKISIWIKNDNQVSFIETAGALVCERLSSFTRRAFGPRSTQIRPIISRIKSERESPVISVDGSQICPDNQFRYRTEETLGVMVQKARRLLTETNSHVRAVVVFDIQYDDHVPQDSSFAV
ncbi:hypothetical protein ACHAPU_011307 [Fusarium lateritium]